MSEAHEHAEHIEHISHTNKKIALMIAVLALFLALSETLGKSAQTGAISDNVEASNLWAFYQAKTIRMTQIRTAAEAMTIDVAAATDADVKSAMAKQIDTWQKTAARYDSEPETGEGRKELSERAKRGDADDDADDAKEHLGRLVDGIGDRLADLAEECDGKAGQDRDQQNLKQIATRQRPELPRVEPIAAAPRSREIHRR